MAEKEAVEQREQPRRPCVPFCVPSAPAGPWEPARCSGLLVCDGAALLRRKRNQCDRNRETAFKPKSHKNIDMEP